MGCNLCWSASVIAIVSVIYIWPLLVKEKARKKLKHVSLYIWIRQSKPLNKYDTGNNFPTNKINEFEQFLGYL